MTPEQVIAALIRRQQSVACAESLTGGLLTARLVDVPGASAVVRGGVVAYANDVKARVLGVDPALLATTGAVHPDVALDMARGVRRVLLSDWGVSTTGVAGPDPSDGMPVGTVFVAVASDAGDRVGRLTLSGGRNEIRHASVVGALGLLTKALG
ncbi:MAG: CinA family protein [Dermatophilaceae bacterium]